MYSIEPETNELTPFQSQKKSGHRLFTRFRGSFAIYYIQAFPIKPEDRNQELGINQNLLKSNKQKGDQKQIEEELHSFTKYFCGKNEAYISHDTFYYIAMSLTNLIILKLLKFNINVQCVTKELKGKYAWLFAADAKPSS